MTTAQKTKERVLKKASGNLPPLALLEVGESIKGTIRDVNIIKTRMKQKIKGKAVESEKIRMFYRVELDSSANIHGGQKMADGKYEQKIFEQGQVVSLPGTGALDSTFRKIALEKMGVAEDDGEMDPDWDTLKGVYVEIQREPDQKMKKGEHEGNKVKVYDVQYSLEG